MFIKAKTEILPPAQMELWPMLKAIPKSFVLYGGTAVALRFGHRNSVDFDFFSSKRDIDLLTTGLKIPFIKDKLVDIRNRSKNQVDFFKQPSRQPLTALVKSKASSYRKPQQHLLLSLCYNI